MTYISPRDLTFPWQPYFDRHVFKNFDFPSFLPFSFLFPSQWPPTIKKAPLEAGEGCTRASFPWRMSSNATTIRFLWLALHLQNKNRKNQMLLQAMPSRATWFLKARSLPSFTNWLAKNKWKLSLFFGVVEYDRVWERCNIRNFTSVGQRKNLHPPVALW